MNKLNTFMYLKEAGLLDGTPTSPIGIGGGTIPLYGNRYFVDSTTGSDTRDGKSWSTALKTLAAAYAKVEDGRGDIIFLSPFHEETFTSTFDFRNLGEKNGFGIIGVPFANRKPTFTFTSGIGHAFYYGSVLSNAVFANFRIKHSGTTSGDAFLLSYPIDCLLYGIDISGGFGYAFNAPTNSSMMILDSLVITTTGTAGILLSKGGSSIVKNTVIMGSYTTACISCGVSFSDKAYFKDCQCSNENATGKCINGPTISGYAVLHNVALYSAAGAQYPVSGRVAAIDVQAAELSTYGTSKIMANQADFTS